MFSFFTTSTQPNHPPSFTPSAPPSPTFPGGFGPSSPSAAALPILTLSPSSIHRDLAGTPPASDPSLPLPGAFSPTSQRKSLPPQPLTLPDERVHQEVLRELDGDARKRRRRWRVWTGCVGLLMEGWTLFLAVRYLVCWLKLDEASSALIKTSAITFFGLSIFTSLAMLSCLIFLRFFHAPSHSHPILLPFVHTLLYLSSICLVVPSAVSLGLLFILKKKKAALGLICEGGWGLDLIWSKVDGVARCVDGTGWGAAIAGRFAVTVVVLAFFHYSLHKTLTLLMIPLPSDTTSCHHDPSKPDADLEKAHYPPFNTPLEFDFSSSRSNSYYTEDAAHEDMRSRFLHRPSMDLTSPSSRNEGGEIRGWYDPRVVEEEEEQALLEEEGEGDVGRSTAGRYHARPYSSPPPPESKRSSFSSMDSATPLMSTSPPPPHRHHQQTDNLTSSPPPRSSSRRTPSTASSRRFLGRSGRRDLSTVESVSLSSEGACADAPADQTLWEQARERRWGSERSNGGRREGSGTETVRTTRGREGSVMGSVKESFTGGGWSGSWWS